MIPAYPRGALWSASVNKLDPKADKVYIIHQILAYGTIDHRAWLFKTYPKDEIIKVFENSPTKDYTPQALNFVEKVLGIQENIINYQEYVSSLPRIVE